MSLIRWDPFAEVDGLFSLGRWPRLTIEGEDPMTFEWSPSADISETDKEYLIRASLPAVSKEDVKVTYADGMLTLSGERRQDEEQKDEKFHKVENYYGNFSRSFALPDVIDADSIRAESRDGVLTIHVPKAQAEVRKLTTIKVQ